jgi:hypothetical protein
VAGENTPAAANGKPMPFRAAGYFD